MFDINQIEADIQKELLDEKIKGAKQRIKEHLVRRAKAEQVLANLDLEYKELLATLATEK